jgi:hypothetical protein
VNGLIGIRCQAILGENPTTAVRVAGGVTSHMQRPCFRLNYGNHATIPVYLGHITEPLGKQINESLKCFRLDPFAYEHPSIMPPTLTLRNYPLDISAWAAASGQTSQIQIANSTPDASLLNLGYSNAQGHTNPLRGCTKKIQT